MNFWVFKLTFSTEVHIGNGLLTDSGYTMYADTFFSALCLEALKIYGVEGIEQLKAMAMEDKLVLSDGFPYIKDTLYIPKPLDISFLNPYCEIKQDTSVQRKTWKKVRYLPLDIWSKNNSKFDIEKELENFKGLGCSSLRIRASIQGLEETMPYGVGGFQFAKDNGMYFIVGLEKEVEEIFDNILNSLQYTGIGGKLSTGMGKFQWSKEEVCNDVKERLCYAEQSKEEINVMTLSVSLPNKEHEDVLENSCYSVIKRSGFVSSIDYTSKRKDISGFTKKKNLYVIQSGSCMAHGYCGDIINVSDDGTHEVLRYAKPLFWRLEQ